MTLISRRDFNRAFLTVAASGALALATGALGVRSGMIPSDDSEAIAANRARFAREEQAKATCEGTFFDAAGNPLTRALSPGTPARVIYPCTNSLLGWRSGSDLSGLRKAYREPLLYSSKEGGGRGTEVHLSTNLALQKAAFELLDQTHRGCILVENVANGELLACVSSYGVELDVNHYSDHYEETYKNVRDLYYDPLSTSIVPGSVMKLVTSYIGLKAGVSEFYTDNGPYHSIKNFGGHYYGKMDLKSAIVHSANTYMAHFGEEAGLDNFRKYAGLFGFTDAEPKPAIVPALDGTPLKSTLGLNAESDAASLQQASFGQGTVLCAPAAVLSWYAALAADPDQYVYSPHSVQYLRDPELSADDPNCIRTIQPAPALPKLFYGAEEQAIQAKMRTAFAASAEKYGLKNDDLSSIYGKTGTAELGNGLNHVTLVFSFRTKQGGTYAALLNQQSVEGTSSLLLKPARELLDAIVKEV